MELANLDLRALPHGTVESENAERTPKGCWTEGRRDAKKMLFN